MDRKNSSVNGYFNVGGSNVRGNVSELVLCQFKWNEIKSYAYFTVWVNALR